MTSQHISPKNQFIRDNKLLPTDSTPIAEEMEKVRKRRVNVKEDKKPSSLRQSASATGLSVQNSNNQKLFQYKPNVSTAPNTS